MKVLRTSKDVLLVIHLIIILLILLLMDNLIFPYMMVVALVSCIKENNRIKRISLGVLFITTFLATIRLFFI